MKRFTNIVAGAALTLAIVGCSSGAAASPQASSSSSPGPDSSSSPSSGSNSSPSLQPVEIQSPEEAAARVVEIAPEFAGIGPKDPDLIGACCFWEATPTADGYEVVFEVGSGDCQAGCIDRQRWTYSVSRDGAVELISESGSPAPGG
jgi:hypothetical protein